MFYRYWHWYVDTESYRYWYWYWYWNFIPIRLKYSGRKDLSPPVQIQCVNRGTQLQISQLKDVLDSPKGWCRQLFWSLARSYQILGFIVKIPTKPSLNLSCNSNMVQNTAVNDIMKYMKIWFKHEVQFAGFSKLRIGLVLFN